MATKAPVAENTSSSAGNIQVLDEIWQTKARIELGETNDMVDSKINQFKDLIKFTKVFPNQIWFGDAFLLRFLRAKKFDVEKSFKMLNKYYSMKENYPELFKVSPVHELNELFEMQIQYMLPNRDANGRRIYMFRVKKMDPYKCTVESVFRGNVLAMENAIREPETQISGIVVVLDFAGVGFGHAKFLAPNLSRRTVEVIQEAFPMRFKAFHILNEPFYFDAILAVLKPFMKEKIRRRIFLHGSNLESLHKYIAKDLLPIEYGGFHMNFDNTRWRQSIIHDSEYFEKLERFQLDDSHSKNETETVQFTDRNDNDDIPFIKRVVLMGIDDVDNNNDDTNDDNFELCESFPVKDFNFT